MSGRHSKPTFYSLHSSEIKTFGGIVVGAAIAGAIAASSAVATPATAARFASRAALADVAAVRADNEKLSRHETHVRHQVHDNRSPGDAAGAGRRAAKAKDASPPARKKTKDKASRRPKGVSAEQVIKLATSQIGITEDGSGETKFNKWFMDDSRAKAMVERDGGSLSDYQGAAWCDMFVSWVGDKLGIGDTMGFDAYTVTHAEWFKDHGRWGDQPKPGAVAFFAWNGGTINDIEHVGFTIKDNGDGTIETVEGNTHSTVAIRTRDKSNVVGYGYPDYKK